MHKQNASVHSRPQSLRSFWPAAGIESSGSNHYERTKEITEFWLSGSLRICIYGACLKWLLPELSIPAAGQKDRGLWGREWPLCDCAASMLFSLRSWRDFARESFCLGSGAVNASGEAVRGFVKSRFIRGFAAREIPSGFRRQWLLRRRLPAHECRQPRRLLCCSAQCNNIRL